MSRSISVPIPCSRFVTIGCLCLIAACLAPLATTRSVKAQVAAAEELVVTAPELPSAYGAPGGFSQSRFSPLTNAYVLPPGEVYASLIYEDAVVHFRRPDHD